MPSRLYLLTRLLVLRMMAITLMKTYRLHKLAGQVKKMRLQQKMTRDELATRANVNYNTVVKIESGANKNPTIKTLVNLAVVFDVGLDDLVG